VTERPVVMVVNPASANGRTAREWPEIARRAAARGTRPEVRVTDSPGHATELTRSALRGGARQILAVGGDGTVSEVVNGFFDGDRLVAPAAELAVVCRGSGCDLIRTFGIPKRTDRALAVAAGGRIRTIDVGRIGFVGHDGAPSVRRFVNAASAGLTGVVAKRVNGAGTPLGATVAFAWSTIVAFAGYRNSRFHVQIDDRRLDAVCSNVIVANCRYFAGGMKILPAAEPDDGLLDVLVWGDVSKADLARNLHKLYRGTHVTHPKADISRATRVEVSPQTPLPIEVDGEVPGTTPAVFDLTPAVLRLRVPAG
jgi:diacylglycerol kinase (ATP)